MERSEIIRAVRLLLEEESVILASSEDYAYFRGQYRAPKVAVAPPLVREVPLPPAPLPPPRVVAAAAVEPVAVTKAAPQKRSVVSFEEIRALLKKVAPQWPILDELPSDEEARFLAERWKTNNQIAPVTLLFFRETPLEVEFLKNVGKAFREEARVVDAKQFEEAHQWPTMLGAKELKLVVISTASLKQLPGLLKHYWKSSEGLFLSKTPLILLPEAASFLRDPLSKRSLWEFMKPWT